MGSTKNSSISFLIVMSILFGPFLRAQYTIEDVDYWIEHKPYQDPKSVDSILIWSNQLEQAGLKLPYPRGVYYANRFRAFYYDYQGDMATSIDLLLQFLRGAQDANHQEDITSAISDLIYMYITIDQYEKAKPLLINVIENAKSNRLNQKQLSAFYNNLGIVYKRSEDLDSAVWAYNHSLEIKESIGDSRGLLDLKINLSSLYEALGQYDKTIQMSQENLQALGPEGSTQDIIHNLSNLSAGLSGKGNYSDAELILLRADSIASSIENTILQEQTNRSLSSFYDRTGQHDKAYARLLTSTSLKSELLNEQSNLQLGALREEYEAEKRTLENKQL